MKVLEGRNINSWNSTLRFHNNFHYFPLMIFFRAHVQIKFHSFARYFSVQYEKIFNS